MNMVFSEKNKNIISKKDKIIQCRRCYILVVIMMFFSTGFYYPNYAEDNGKKYSSAAEADAIWNLDRSGDFQDDQLVGLLGKIKNMPEKLWRKVLTLAREDQRQGLRDYLIYRFSENFPYHGQNAEIQSEYITLLNDEFKRILSIDQPVDQDVNRLILALKSISRWNLKEMFYQTSLLIVYPLLEVRKAANETLAIIKDDRIYPIVLKLAESENPIERTYAIDTLFYFKDERTFSILLQLLNDKNKSVRYYAVRTLDTLNMQDAIPYYIRILHSDISDEVRTVAIQVLTRLRSPLAYNSLLEMLSDSNAEIRKAALIAINEYNNVNSAYYISRQLAQETNMELKLLEIKSLLMLNNSGMMAGLNHIVKDETNINILIWAIYTVGKLADFNGYEILLEKLNHGDVQIREETAMALGNFKLKKSVPYLFKVLENKLESYPVQAAALYSLEMIDDSSVLPGLNELSSRHHDILVRAEIKGVLKNMLEKRFK